MRMWTRILLLSSIACGIHANQDTTSHHEHSEHPPQVIEPWAKSYLMAIANAGTLQSYVIDNSTPDFVFPARIKKSHGNKNLCHGAIRTESLTDGKFKPAVFARSFYGWDSEYCEWLTAVSYATMKPEERKTDVKDPTLFFYRVPEETDDNMFLYTESRETLQSTFDNVLKTLPPQRKQRWDSVSKEWNNEEKQKPAAVKLINNVCTMMETQNLWPAKFRGTINRIPLSSGLLIAMSEMGAQLELADDNDPTLNANNRLIKVADFYKRYAGPKAQKSMEPWLWSLGNGTRADQWVSNYQLEITMCNAPDNSVGSQKLKSYQSSEGDVDLIYPPTCTAIWNKVKTPIVDEPVVIDYGAAMKIGKFCGPNGDQWCRPELIGITSAQYPAVMERIRETNMKLLYSLKRRGRGPITAEYNALIDRLIQLTVSPGWATDEIIKELRSIATRVLDILYPKPVIVTPKPTKKPIVNQCCCCMGCSTCCGRQRIRKLRPKKKVYDVDSDERD